MNRLCYKRIFRRESDYTTNIIRTYKRNVFTKPHCKTTRECILFINAIAVMKNKKNDLVSVIIPTFSRPYNLERAIKSTLSQTYKNIEIIIVDDNGIGSKYQIETEKAIRNYIKKGEVKYIKHDINKNGATARNTGLKASKGIYVNFLDDDDEFLPDKIKNQVDLLEKNIKYAACCCDSIIQYHHHKI